jgi:hypothetical protein
MKLALWGLRQAQAHSHNNLIKEGLPRVALHHLPILLPKALAWAKQYEAPARAISAHGACMGSPDR